MTRRHTGPDEMEELKRRLYDLHVDIERVQKRPSTGRCWDDPSGAESGEKRRAREAAEEQWAQEAAKEQRAREAAQRQAEAEENERARRETVAANRRIWDERREKREWKEAGYRIGAASLGVELSTSSTAQWKARASRTAERMARDGKSFVPGACTHEGDWDKEGGRYQCERCGSVLSMYAYRCPCCLVTSCGRCMHALKKGKGQQV